MRPITEEILPVMERRRAVRNFDLEYVFHRFGKKIDREVFRRAWKESCASVGRGALLFHDVRRSAVRDLIRAGVPEEVAMDFTGHKTRSVLARYNIVSTADMEDAAGKRAAYFRRKAGEAERKVLKFGGVE